MQRAGGQAGRQPDRQALKGKQTSMQRVEGQARCNKAFERQNTEGQADTHALGPDRQDAGLLAPEKA